jgi:hypothetical protein
MVIKYYGKDIRGGLPSLLDMYFADPYRNKPEDSPSWSVWIVPGTVDNEGNHIEEETK